MIDNKLSRNTIELIAKDGLSTSLMKETYPVALNPFRSPLITIDEEENIQLNKFLEQAILAKNIDDLSKVVKQALNLGIKINAPNKENEVSFANLIILKIYHDKFGGNKQKDIIKKLALNGAEFDFQFDEKTTEVCNKVKKEVEPQILDRLKKLREVGESATIGGTVTEVSFDNQTFHLEFSHSSKVDIAKVLSGARNLGFSKGNVNISNNIIKIGKDQIKVRTGENGERNYIDISDNAAFMVTFPSSVGPINVKIWHDVNNPDQVYIDVEDKNLWSQLQERGEIVGHGCLFGGMSVKSAIEVGGFMRFSKKARPQSSESVSWVDRTKNNKTTSIIRS